jgi:hypothetical protein
MSTIDQMISELLNTKTRTISYDTPLKVEQRRQLKNKLAKERRPRLTEAEEWKIADRQLIQLKENI